MATVPAQSDDAHLRTRAAVNADIVDANPPQLRRYDRWASEVDEIEHHPAMLDSKRAMWDSGYVSGFAADERARGRTTPGTGIAAAHYLVSQADTGLVCSMGMTSGVAGLVDAYAPPDVRAPLLAGLRANRIEDGIDGSMFLTEREGGSDLGHTVHVLDRALRPARLEDANEGGEEIVHAVGKLLHIGVLIGRALVAIDSEALIDAFPLEVETFAEGLHDKLL